MLYIIKDLEAKTERTLDIADIILGTNEGDNKAVLRLADGSYLTLSPADRYEVNAKQKEPEPPVPTLPTDPPKPSTPRPDPITQIQLAVAELAEASAQNNLNNKLAIAELAEIVAGGKTNG